jgi:3-mercaptopyruvate sulfurtransferase SseA
MLRLRPKRGHSRVSRALVVDDNAKAPRCWSVLDVDGHKAVIALAGGRRCNGRRSIDLTSGARGTSVQYGTAGPIRPCYSRVVWSVAAHRARRITVTGVATLPVRHRAHGSGI